MPVQSEDHESDGDSDILKPRKQGDKRGGHKQRHAPVQPDGHSSDDDSDILKQFVLRKKGDNANKRGGSGETQKEDERANATESPEQELGQ